MVERDKKPDEKEFELESSQVWKRWAMTDGWERNGNGKGRVATDGQEGDGTG
jgi:hypothetical protein